MTTETGFRQYLPQLVLLAICNALSMTAQSMMITSGAIMGKLYAGNLALATLPVACQLLGVVVAMKLVATMIERYGMKRAFLMGAFVGLIGGLALMKSVQMSSFILICISLLITGTQVATASYYRFAAADIVPVQYKPRAVSIVIFGAIAAAFIGPTLSISGRYFSEEYEFLGIGRWYAILMALQLAVLVFTKIVIVKPVATNPDGVVRSIKTLMQDNRFLIGMVTTTVSFSVMTLIMNATPLEMEHNHFAYEATANVIQWHVVGMFLPSLFAGLVIERFGYRNVLIIGCICLMCCSTALLIDSNFSNFLVGNILLGVGWNFLLIGGTALLAVVYTEEERTKTQYYNNLIVFLTNFVAAALSGGMHSTIGWAWMNWITIAVIMVTFGMILKRVPATKKPT